MTFPQLVRDVNVLENAGSPIGLVRLVDRIRPPKKKPELAEEKLAVLLAEIRQFPEAKRDFIKYLKSFICSRQSVQLFTDSGMPTGKGFFTEAFDRINSWFLPRLYGETDHTATFNEIFHETWDHKWVQLISREAWVTLFLEFEFEEFERLDLDARMTTHLLNSILVVSQRVAAMGLEPEILAKLPELEEFDSPFVVQNKEIFSYLDAYQNSKDFDRSDQNADYKQILVMLSQCVDYVNLIRKNKRRFGADISLTYLLNRINQNINRLRTLMRLAVKIKGAAPFESEIELLKALVYSENKKNSLQDHFDTNVRLLAFQVTEHAGRTGEHYIANTGSEWMKMLYKAMGGGLIVGFLSIFKVFIYYMKASPFGEAFLYSMNYSLGFIGIHVSHSTLATKQPAMTASKLAAALDEVTKPKDKAIENLAEVILRLSRSQFIAFVGNVFAAFPVAFLLAYGYHWYYGEHVAGSDKAIALINELHPFNSYAIFHAGIAGVFLFLSGLISGYYDNKSVYNKIPQRIQQHKLLVKIFGKTRMVNFGNYIDQNLGSLAGNFFLGIFLGSTGTIGYILGLPLDIRHITFSSGNFGLAVASIGHKLNDYQVFMSILGIILIGLMNFLVSFSLAIFVAIKSRGVNFKETRKLIRTILVWFVYRPSEFFFPPRVSKLKKKPENELLDKDENDQQNSSDESEKVRPTKD
ncbi:Site-specific recombinase [Algoriphagus faecimaris]|uniref:Site-specific recombinase n=1 Tax=Algoriphagus faecimaris TaxID=686796 RepID=A0A1G6RXR0_9BACT|nr:site-specific recombinase [Algoriphagus faecimaris]SDD08726.1 Site-specific recombinase [Algoriphagus faecimaris]